jgi:D-alanyl-D-alanine dipeptidase
MNMFEALESETGVSIGLSDGMRKRPPSYFSMHSTGLAMDLGVPRGGQTICYGGSTTNGWGSLEAAERVCAAKGGDHYKAYKWLRGNAAKFGFTNYDKEPWHYSTSGNGV